MIVLKYTYNKSITSTFSFSFNSGFTPTTTEETSGNLVTVTVESDTPFTTIGIPGASKAGLVAVHYMDLSNVSKTAYLFEGCVNLTDVTLNNSTTKLTDISNTFYFYADNSHKNPINISFVNCNLSAIPDNLANNFINAEYKNIPSLTFDNCVLSNGTTMGKIIGSCTKEAKLIFKNCTTAPSTSFVRMFYGTGRTEVDLSGIDFTNVTSTCLMFSNSKVEKVVLPKGYFYNLTNLSYMFEGAYYIKEVDLSDFHVMNPQDISYMFYNCKELEKVNLSGIKMDKALSFSHMFYGSSVCKWFDISNLTTSPSNTMNFWKSPEVVENVGMLYCPANVINTVASLLVGSGRTCNIYYHDAKLEDLTVDSRFNYIYCEEYHGDVVETPNDLELYKVNDTTYDKLDLTTGTLYKNTGTYVLDETFVDRTSNWEVSIHDTTGNVTFTSRQHKYLRDEHNFPYSLYNNAIVSNADPASNIVNNSNIEITRPRLYFDIYSNNNYTVIIMPASYNVTTLEELRTWLQNNPMIFNYKLGTPYTEQLSLNPLKSYRNGSIQTSSQQLVPTLKTTLPISNKFTTTNLTSGSTYNVYFDGTATKLDAGGTIITNPISPCEVECGGTTLTIEGTDIQNVRVLETTVKNEVGSVNGTTDVELKKMKTCKYENILDNIKYSTTVWNGAVINIDYDDFCIEFMGAHGWAGEFADTGLKYPTGCSLVHVEFDIDMDNPNLRMAINFNEGIYNSYPQHRHITLNNDTATIAQGNYDNIYTSIITKGHFSRLMYANGDRPIIINLYTGSYITGNLATGNSAEGSINGYETIGSNYGRITNLKMRIIENFSSNYTTVTSVLRDSSYNIIWQDMDMTIPQTISNLEQPIKLRSLGTTYDSYNPVTGELIKRIGVSETDGSYSVLSSPIVTNVPMGEQITNIVNKTPTNDTASNVTFEGNAIKVSNGYGIFLLSEMKPSTKYTAFVEYITNGRFIVVEGTNVNGFPISNNGNQNAGTKLAINFTTRSATEHILTLYGGTTLQIMIVEGTYSNYDDLPYFEGVAYKQVPPHLYTNGQVKVYSESEVYPTTILNGQSTNNYEINELNKSNNYTIRYDGECESINLANKSNEQGTNRIIKSGATSGNLTFVNDSGDIDNVLLTQGDVREQEIKHFNGLQTVEVSGMLIENQRNMWSQDYIIDTTLTANYKRISKDYIKVVPNETLYCSTGKAWMDYSDIIQYNENKERVTTTQIFGWATSGMYQDENNIYKNKVQLSEKTHYIRICMHTGMATTASVSRGDFLPPSTLAYNQYQGQYIDLPQPVQLNGLPDGTCDTYNPITGEYVQNVGYFVLDDTFASSWLVSTLNGHHYAQRQVSTKEPNYLTLTRDYGFPSSLYDYQTGTKAIANIPIAYSMLNTGDKYPIPSLFGDTWFGNYHLRIALPFMVTEKDQWNYSHTQVNDWLRENPIHIAYKRTEPITTQLTPINIPTFEGGIVQLITTDGKVFPMIEYSMSTNNRYDTSSWEAGKVYTQRNMTEVYFNDSTTPMTPTETMTLTTDHISSGSIILNDNGNGLIVLKGNYTGRDIPYFTGMRSVEAIEVEVTPSPDQPLFGKGGRK